MGRAIQFRDFGGLDALEMAQVPDTQPQNEEVRVDVLAAGLNPLDAKTLQGSAPVRIAERVQTLRHPERWFGGGPARFPRTVGRDFSGIVDAVGPGVRTPTVGTAVMGTLRSAPGDATTRGSLTEELIAPVSDVVAKPEVLSFEEAGALGVTAQTACGALRCLEVSVGDVLVVSGASGGVGSMVVQLATNRGASVIGIASTDNAEYLRSLGAIPLAYGGELERRIRAVAPAPITKFLDCYGGDYIKLGLALGVNARWVGSLVPSPLALIRGTRFTGSRHAQPGDLPEVADLVAAGRVRVTIEHEYPFDLPSVREAYAQLLRGHIRGKLVVRMS